MIVSRSLVYIHIHIHILFSLTVIHLHIPLLAPVPLCPNRAINDIRNSYRSDNIIDMELNMPDRTTQDYEGPAMSQRVQAALSAALEGDEEEVTFATQDTLPQTGPYLSYNPDDGGGGGGVLGAATGQKSTRDRQSRDGGGGRRKRPGTASRKRGGRRDEGRSEAKSLISDEFDGHGMDDHESQYPQVNLYIFIDIICIYVNNMYRWWWDGV